MNEAPLSSGPITVHPGPAVFHITPIGFFGRAEDFLEASVLLSQKKGRFSFVAAHLSCSAIELALKAFLLAKGYSKPGVKKLGHNLQRACETNSFLCK